MKLWPQPYKTAYTPQQWGISPTLKPIHQVPSDRSKSTQATLSCKRAFCCVSSSCHPPRINNVENSLAFKFKSPLLCAYRLRENAVLTLHKHLHNAISYIRTSSTPLRDALCAPYSTLTTMGNGNYD